MDMVSLENWQLDWMEGDVLVANYGGGTFVVRHRIGATSTWAWEDVNGPSLLGRGVGLLGRHWHQGGLWEILITSLYIDSCLRIH